MDDDILISTLNLMRNIRNNITSNRSIIHHRISRENVVINDSSMINFVNVMLNNFNMHEFENYFNLEDTKIVLNERIFLEKTEKIETNEFCGICKEQIVDGLIIKKCGHIYCKDCIYTWLTKYDVKCPICRIDCRS